ncbi:DUF1214 domain-containing protein [Photobacterium gaetbulicola]|uniref:DUF1214 domain-containing protein n=2 Tax=Photobacterium gaetbulicola TaxID=1295392 RepID=A0A0C5WJ48_9GAMM|nr:DUF1214 domain-containing protein [Photobacterium gaetbulicola]AJR05179.1 hypothetical protein H744_1c0150 [Photobacterium gaetbulicola Gung47]KHT64212.1 hypothetical protein RJ45_07480 [Photobacterium gaetbulicola]PSU06014.1 DUF1214 domain-containing protein [Photobacterium gaetbulicola]
MKKTILATVIAITSMQTMAAVEVTDANFARAETDLYFTQQLERQPINRFDHNRDNVTVDNQMIIRSNTDLLYSTAVVDVSKGATFRLAKGDAYQIMHFFNNNHDNHMAIYGGEEIYIDSKKAGSDYIYILMRTATTAGMDEAHRLQDAAVIDAKSAKPFKPAEDWDNASRDAIRAKWEKQVTDIKTEKAFTTGITATPDNKDFMIGTASGWAGLPADYAIYSTRAGTGKVECASITFEKPTLSYDKGGYWSITAYSGEGWLMTDKNSADSTSATANKDGSYTIHFAPKGEACGAANNVIEMNDAGWNFVLRAYRPIDKAQAVEEMQNFPNAVAK